MVAQLGRESLGATAFDNHHGLPAESDGPLKFFLADAPKYAAIVSGNALLRDPKSMHALLINNKGTYSTRNPVEIVKGFGKESCL